MLGFCGINVKRPDAPAQATPGVVGTNREAWQAALDLGLPIVAVTLADGLSLAIAIAVQRPLEIRVCPNPADLFIDILAEVGYVEDTTPIVEARISQVFS